MILYHGDNGFHEFYETEHLGPGHMVIIRNREGRTADPAYFAEPRWFVLLGPAQAKRVPAAESLSELVRGVAAALGERLEIDPAREWRDVPGKPHKHMELAEVEGVMA